MGNNQLKYIEYVEGFCENNRIHSWLGGSFLRGDASFFSDVDLSVCCDKEKLKQLIYGYGQPVFISNTVNPPGILIVIYEDGVAVDLEIVKKMDVTDNVYFHKSDIKKEDYIRDEKIYREIVFCEEESYQISRLFHRSIIKFLSGKRENGVSIANEIADFMNCDEFIDEIEYRNKFPDLLNDFKEQYSMPTAYYRLLCELLDVKRDSGIR